MHALQQHILREITLGGPRRFAQLKPKQIDGNQFVYHLRALERAGYVSRTQGGYCLTAEGKRYVERVSIKEFKERIQPKIVTLAVVKNTKGEYLLYKRRRMPMRGLIGFPYGKVHLGERLEQAAHRELGEKTGLSATLKLRGHMYLTVHDEEELVTQMLCHVFAGREPMGDLREEFPAGDSFWRRIEDVPHKELMPGISLPSTFWTCTRTRLFQIATSRGAGAGGRCGICRR
jgi:ADP-ribose pyrophosphatase YjhB (NUDIX family)